ncbi:MAG: Gfo/Idh/MocA family oxidoreductase [Alistipes sp.]|nr:Gfo/Idh/MocA family oxidoreductase [Alistipes sp.]
MNQNKKINRRDFLKELGFTAGTATLLSSFPWLAGCTEQHQKETAGEKPARIGVIGPGSRGQYLLGFLMMNPKADVVWLCDTYQPSLDAALKMAPAAKTCKDYRQVLDDPSVDAVVIATPLHTHREIAVAAMEAGKQVFCEKSVARTLEDTRAVYDTHKRTGQILFIDQQRLFDPVYIKAMEMIRSGMFGEIDGIKTFWNRNNDWRRPLPSPDLERQINWRLYKEYSCGLMTELGCHQIQMGTWIWRKLPTKIYGQGAIVHWKDGREVEDNVGVTYTYEDGRRMTFDSIISNQFYGLEEQIMGNLGTVEPEKGKYYFEQTPPMPGFLQILNNIEKDVFSSVSFAGPSWDPEVARQNHGAYILGAKRDFLDGTGFTVDAFVEAVLSGKQPPMIAEEGYYATILALLGQQSIEENRELPFPEEYRIDYL